MFRFEKEKFRRQHIFVAAAAAVMLAFYISSAFGGTELMAGWSQSYYWDNPEYREYMQSHEAAVMDEARVRKIQEDYCAFVSENRRTDEEIKAFMEEWYDEEWLSMGEEPPVYEEIIADPCNFAYAHDVLREDAYYSRQFEEFDQAFRFYIPLAQNPAAYITERLGTGTDTSYSARQTADRKQLTEKIFRDFTLVTGSCCGWDVLICVGKNLPYTLGLVLLAALCSSFSVEQSSSMLPLLRTARCGRRKLVSVKLIRAWKITTILWLFFQFGMLLAVAAGYGLEGAEVTVMHYLGYPSFYGLNNLQYYLIQSAFSYFGTLLQGLFICLLSTLFSVRLSLPLGLVITLLTGYPNESFAYSDQCFSLWEKITALTPAQMMGAFTTLQTYQSYDTGVFLILLPAAVTAAMAAEAFVMLRIIDRIAGGK